MMNKTRLLRALAMFAVLFFASHGTALAGSVVIKGSTTVLPIAQKAAEDFMKLYPDVNIFLQSFANPGEHDTKRMLLNMITTSLYLGLPVLWSGMMAWAGIQVGRSISAAVAPMTRPAEESGKRGGMLGEAALGRGLRR